MAWDPVPDPDVNGYLVYYGTATGVYTQSANVGNVTQTTISGLTDCTNYFFAVKASDTSGNQSTSYSNEIQGWPRPVVASATPSAAEQGRTLTLTIAGSNFRVGATPLFSRAGITVNSATVSACGQLTLSVTVGNTAMVGASDISVTNSDGTFGTGTAVFTVQGATAPTVASTSPADGAAGVSIAVTPHVTFGEAMLRASITTTSVRLLDSTGAAVSQRAGSPSLSANGLTATIAPATDLMPGETYRIQVVGGASGVLDIANHEMGSTFTHTTGFTTASDTLPPSITGVGSSAVGSTTATITWTTNEASDSQVFYRKTGATTYQNTSIDGTLVTSHSAPLAGLDPFTTYEYYVRSADAAGNAATSSPTQTFSTAANPFIYLQFEAESGMLVAPVRTNMGAVDAFGSGYIDTPTGTPTAGTATFGVNLPSDGTWYLWVRIYAPEAGADTWYESIDGAAPQQIVPTATGQWQWVEGRSYALSSGLSTLELGAGSAQARADRVLLTDDPTFVPTEQPLDDQTPPVSDTGLTAAGGTSQVALNWINSSSPDFSQTIIRYRTDGKFPVSPVDGLAVVTKAGAAGSADSFLHSGLTNGTTYFYSAFAQDMSGNVSWAANAAAIAGDLPPLPVIALVQHAGNDAGTVTSSSLMFPSSNTAGNLIAVIVRVGRSNATISVEDTSGNVYRPAASLDVTVDPPYGDTLAIFYAENVQAGVNTVTVSSSLANASLRFALLEYAGLAPSSSLDGSASAQGIGFMPNSGSLTTTENGDLLLGAVATAGFAVFTPDSGFTVREDVSAKLTVEDRVQGSVGPESAGGSLLVSDRWGAMVAAFRAGPPVPQPDLTLMKTHTGSFVQGQPDATYTLTVTNVGSAAGIGTVTVTDTLPAGLTATGMDGAGWSCTLATTTCTRVDGLAPSSSYPPITLTVSVAADAASSVTNTASVSGGGELNTGNDAASDVAPIESGPDTQGPTAPGGLTAAPAAADRIDLNWTASTDDVGVTGYRLEQCQGAACTDFTEIDHLDLPTYHSVTGLVPGTYRYRLRAEDAAGNLGPYSDVASATIPAIWLAQQASVDAGSVTSASLAFPTANVAGNFIAVAIQSAPANEALTITDSLGNSYQKATRSNDRVDGTVVDIYYTENIAAGPNAVIVSKPQSGALRFAIFEYSGVALTGSLDETAGAEGTSATPDSGTVTPASDGELVIGVVATANEDTFAAGAGYVIRQTLPAAPYSKLIVEDQTQTTAGPLSAGATLSSSETWAAVVATFRAR